MSIPFRCAWLAVALMAVVASAAEPSNWRGDSITGSYRDRLVPRDETQPATVPSWLPATRPTTAPAPGAKPTSKPAVPTGPNIILIIVSDQSAGMTGFEGHPQIKTPSLDRLAADGVYFQRCYTPTPLSGTSRASILTGQYPHAHGATAEKAALDPKAETFTAQLKEAGYTSGIVGKWNLPSTGAKAPGFGLTDYVATEDADAEDRGWKWDQCPVWLQGEKKTADKFLTDWEADRAIDFVEKHKERPFFLWLSFRTNQEPLTWPPGLEKQYPPDKVDTPDPKTKARGDLPPSLNNVKAATDSTARDEGRLREARSKYYAMISRMDENIGRLMARLDELNLRNKTVVIFTSDGGFALGEHGLYGRGPFIYDVMVRCPLVVRYPGLIGRAGRCPHVVSLVDLAPTICGLAGLRPSPMVHGFSLLPLLRDPESTALPGERFLEYDASALLRGLVTSQYKYARYPREGNCDVLYHLTRDAEEIDNVARKPDTARQYAAVVKVFQNRLDQWRKKTRDPAK
jgi:arylsulfatase